MRKVSITVLESIRKNLLLTSKSFYPTENQRLFPPGSLTKPMPKLTAQEFKTVSFVAEELVKLKRAFGSRFDHPNEEMGEFLTARTKSTITGRAIGLIQFAASSGPFAADLDEHTMKKVIQLASYLEANNLFELGYKWKYSNSIPHVAGVKPKRLEDDRPPNAVTKSKPNKPTSISGPKSNQKTSQPTKRLARQQPLQIQISSEPEKTQPKTILDLFIKSLEDVLAAPGALANRPRQIETVRKLLADARTYTGTEHMYRAMFDIAGGFGKTVVFNRIAQACANNGMRILIVAPRNHLIEQADKKMRALIHDDMYPLLLSHPKNKKRPAANVGISIVTNAALVKRFGEAIKDDDYDLVVYDEAQWMLGPKNKQVAEAFSKKAIVQGYTASPDFNELRSIQEFFGPPVDKISFVTAIKSNLTAETRTVVLHTGTRIGLDKLDMRGGDYDNKQIERAINISSRNMMMLQFYASFYDEKTGYRAFGKEGYAYLGGVDHARDFATLFNHEFHEIFASIHLEAARLRDPRFQLLAKPLDGEMTDDYRKGFDKAQAVLIREMLAAKKSGHDVTPLPSAVVHGGMTRRQVREVYEAHELGIVKIISNDQMAQEGVDNPRASLVYKAKPTRSKRVNTQESVRGSRLNPNDPEKIAWVVDLVDLDTWEEINKYRDAKVAPREIPRLAAEVLDWQAYVRSEARHPHRGPIRQTDAANGTSNHAEEYAVAKVPLHLRLPADAVTYQVEELNEFYQAVKIASTKPIRNTTITSRERENFVTTMAEKGLSFSDIEAMARKEFAFSRINAFELHHATRADKPKTINTEHWETVKRVLDEAKPLFVSVAPEQLSFVQAALTAAGFEDKPVLEKGGPLNIRNVMVHLGIHSFPWNVDYYIETEQIKQIKSDEWERLNNFISRLQEPTFARKAKEKLATDIHGNLMLAQKDQEYFGCVKEVPRPDLSHSWHFAKAATEIFEPTKLRFGGQKKIATPKGPIYHAAFPSEARNLEYELYERVFDIAAEAVTIEGQSYSLPAKDFKHIMLSEGAKCYEDDRFWAHAFVRQGEERPSKREWDSIISDFVDNGIASYGVRRHGAVPGMSVPIPANRGLAWTFARACWNEQVLPKLQLAAQHLYAHTPTPYAPDRRGELQVLAAVA